MKFGKFRRDMDIFDNDVDDGYDLFHGVKLPCWIIRSKTGNFEDNNIIGTISKVTHGQYNVHEENAAKVSSHIVREMSIFSNTPLQRRGVDNKTHQEIKNDFINGAKFQNIIDTKFKFFRPALPKFNQYNLDNDHFLYHIVTIIIHLRVGMLMQADKNAWIADTGIKHLLKRIHTGFMKKLKDNLYSNSHQAKARQQCYIYLKQLSHVIFDN